MWSYLMLAIMPVADAGGDFDVHHIRGQIDLLGSQHFAEREQATRQLIRAGHSALPHLESALKSTNVELRSRALRVFGEWLSSPDAQLASAAEAALSRLAKSRATIATSARARLAAAQLVREAALLAEIERLVPLMPLAAT
jgi:hypothetical protein